MLKRILIKNLRSNISYRGTTEPKFRETIDTFFNNASKYTSIPEDRLAILNTPDTTLKVNIPLLRDDGTFCTITAFRCHHKLHRFPAKGGLRISPRITFSSIEALALISCFQLSLLEIPFGGAKGGIRMDVTKFSDAEIERVLRRYTIELAKYNFIGPGVDVPGPEYGSNEWHMDIMKDTYQTIYGMKDIHSIAVVTGKSYGAGGVPNHNLAPASGVYYTIKHLLQDDEFKNYLKFFKINRGLKGQKIIIEGFGEMGRNLAKFLTTKGAIIIGIQEWDGCLYNPFGIDIEEFSKYYENNKTVQGYIDTIDSEEILSRECDILAITHSVRGINRYNVTDINTKMVVEACNGGISLEADRILTEKKKVLVVPDILCNSGGQISSYLEWLKNIQHKRLGRLTSKWQEKSRGSLMKGIEEKIREAGYNINLEGRIDKYLKKGASNKDIIQSSIENFVGEAMSHTVHKSLKEETDLRTAAFSIAMDRIYDSYRDNNLFK